MVEKVKIFKCFTYNAFIFLSTMFMFPLMLHDHRFELRVNNVITIEDDDQIARKSVVCKESARMPHLDADLSSFVLGFGGIMILWTKFHKTPLVH